MCVLEQGGKGQRWRNGAMSVEGAVVVVVVRSRPFDSGPIRRVKRRRWRRSAELQHTMKLSERLYITPCKRMRSRTEVTHRLFRTKPINPQFRPGRCLRCKHGDDRRRHARESFRVLRLCLAAKMCRRRRKRRVVPPRATSSESSSTVTTAFLYP